MISDTFTIGSPQSRPFVQMHWADAVLWIDGDTSVSLVLSPEELCIWQRVLSHWRKSSLQDFNESHRDEKSKTCLFEMFFDEEFQVGMYLYTRGQGLMSLTVRIPKDKMEEFVAFVGEGRDHVRKSK